MTKHYVMRHIRQLVSGDLSRKDLLIEHLHCINDYFGCLPKNYMASLADLMGLAHVEVYEVASFYHHFTIVEKVPDHSRVTIRACNSSSCCMAGNADLLSALQQQSLDHQRFVVEPAPCVGRCEQAPVAVCAAKSNSVCHR
jgi:NADH:ubiquinone oxidoreductase 24 kD subunit